MFDARTSGTVELAALIQAVNALRAPNAACIEVSLEWHMRQRIKQLIEFLELDTEWPSWRNENAPSGT